MATSRDIARLAGVSQATVSRVLQGRANVSPHTRQHVLDVVQETGYVADEQARALRTRRSGTVGVVTGSITNPFYPALLTSLGRAITARGLRMAVWTADMPSGESAAVEAIRGRLVDGLIFTTAIPESEALADALATSLPVVLVNRTIDGIDCDQVSDANVAGGMLAARYFIEHGRHDAAVVGGNEPISTGRERRQGFVREYRSNGLKLGKERVPECEFDHDAARDVGIKLLDSSSPPSAVFCVNDLIAFGILDAAARLGIRVPDDVWVIGYDDVAMAAWEIFDLTTLRQPVSDMAETTVDLLMARIAGTRTTYEHRRFAAELVIRGSTGWASLSRS